MWKFRPGGTQFFYVRFAPRGELVSYFRPFAFCLTFTELLNRRARRAFQSDWNASARHCIRKPADPGDSFRRKGCKILIADIRALPDAAACLPPTPIPSVKHTSKRFCILSLSTKSCIAFVQQNGWASGVNFPRD